MHTPQCGGYCRQPGGWAGHSSRRHAIIHRTLPGRDSTVATTLPPGEPRNRARLLEIESYRVELDLTLGDATFESVATVSFRCARPGAAPLHALCARRRGR